MAVKLSGDRMTADEPVEPSSAIRIEFEEHLFEQRPLFAECHVDGDAPVNAEPEDRPGSLPAGEAASVVIDGAYRFPVRPMNI